MFQVRQEKFEGPLELLLELIEKEKLAISEISLAKVAEEYLKHLKTLEKIDPETLAEFLVIAAQLMLIKSRSLIPNLKLSQEEEASIEELQRRLAAYQTMREFAKELKGLETKHFFILTREAYAGMEPIFYPPPKLTLEKLKRAFEIFLESLPKIEKLAEERIKKIISLEEKIKSIRSFLENAAARTFREIIAGSKEKVDIIVSFLAILELAKQKLVSVEQKNLFADIKVQKT